ncbi:hypothetical protein [Ewingella americana]|uniref:Uncharacterized protein n=1 Tax=Ewingella americana TaxID=41202 RepID=A0A502GFG9_9GAMM|nr:hypothetical protein [Ewingella americana]TPG60030.1 hypothetical protein EAH77_15800 [Ewingella americana]
MSEMIKNAIRAAIVVTPTATKNRDPKSTFKNESRTNQYMRKLCIDLGKSLFGDEVNSLAPASFDWSNYQQHRDGKNYWAYLGPSSTFGSMLDRFTVQLIFLFNEGTTGYVMAGYTFQIQSGRVDGMQYETFYEGVENNKTLIASVQKNWKKVQDKWKMSKTGDRSAEHLLGVLKEVKTRLGSNWGAITGPAMNYFNCAEFKLIEKMSGYAMRVTPGPDSALGVSMSEIEKNKKTRMKTYGSLSNGGAAKILNPKSVPASIKEALDGITVGTVTLANVDVEVNPLGIALYLDFVAK